jgi:flagellar motility protein MotE (MotC chaperone)
MSQAKQKTGRKRRPPGRGALFMIASLLLGSAVIRLGDGAGQAFARSSTGQGEASIPHTSSATCETPEDLQVMLTAFQDREMRLQERELALRDRMQALRVADQEIERKLAALIVAEEELRQTLALADTAAEDDLIRLTKVYENMKPKQAAALFEEMDPQFAAGFLARMRPEIAAAVMAGLSPGAAHTFSVVLAGRNANVPSE